jgi:xanthine dehydrogenase small subunit
MKDIAVMVNDLLITPRTPRGTPALDFIRGELLLTGTKEGCREGDCGACAVLVGEKQSGMVRYRAYPSCLLALGDLDGRHLITIEGLRGAAPEGLTPVMRAFLEENASQCGFCTPGFIISLTAWLAESTALDLASAMAAVDGNLCRCTGYGSIRRAAARLAMDFSDLPPPGRSRLDILVDRQVLPQSALEFRDTAEFGIESDKTAPNASATVFLGGGTDYYVKNPEPDDDFSPSLLRSMQDMTGLGRKLVDGKEWLVVGAATNLSDFFAFPELQAEIPGLKGYENRFASTLVRNLATVGGNLVNASPVADLTAMLLALGAFVEIASPALKNKTRRIGLDQFYLDYKKTALGPGEYVQSVSIPRLGGSSRRFSFEKISKRENLDIAAVNTALSFVLESGTCKDVRISAGGIAPVPRLLPKAARVLEGKKVAGMDARELAALARLTAETAAAEASPIDDVRGSAGYRKRMVSRLVLAHFLRCFEDSGLAGELYP